MFCKYCGREIDDGSNFCVFCGRNQSRTSRDFAGDNVESIYVDSRPTTSTKKIGVRIGIAVAIVAVVIAGVAIGAIVTNASPGQNDAVEEEETIIEAPIAESDDDQEFVSLKEATKGDLVTYGKYCQNSGSKKEPIEWVVLRVKDGRALLLSAKTLDCRPISSSIPTDGVTWERSDIREWLNSSFLNAFTEAELKGIDTIQVKQSNSADGKTLDKVFLLSKAQFTKYVPAAWAKAEATKYAREQGAGTFDSYGSTNWWLRDYNSGSSSFLNVLYDGTINELGYVVTENDVGVRPAMWVSLNGKGKDGTETQPVEANGSQETPEEQGLTNDKKITLIVEAADGSELSGTVRRDESGFVISDSSSREYTIEELKALNLSDAELCIAWNEPFARQGYHFKNPQLRAYFESCDWYSDTGSASYLTGVAAVNNYRLRQIADESTSSIRWKDLATS